MTKATREQPTRHVQLEMHYHDNDGWPDQLEVVDAPTTARFGLDLIQTSTIHLLHIHEGHILVFGTPKLGRGRVAYQVYEWDVTARALDAVLLIHPPSGCEDCAYRCCTMHNRNCEPPSELCCGACTEAAHGLLGRHADGSACIAPDLSGFGVPPANTRTEEGP